MLHPSDMPLRLLSGTHKHLDGQPDFYIETPERLMWLACHYDSSTHFKLIVLDMEAQVTFDRRSARQMRTTHNRPLPTWARPTAACALLMIDNGWLLRGGQFLFVGDEPLGIRYEHAMALAFLTLCHQAFNDPCDFIQLLDEVDLATRRYLKQP